MVDSTFYIRYLDLSRPLSKSSARHQKAPISHYRKVPTVSGPEVARTEEASNKKMRRLWSSIPGQISKYSMLRLQEEEASTTQARSIRPISIGSSLPPACIPRTPPSSSAGMNGMAPTSSRNQMQVEMAATCYSAGRHSCREEKTTGFIKSGSPKWNLLIPRSRQTQARHQEWDLRPRNRRR